MKDTGTEATAEVVSAREDLSRELRQISGALWNAADSRNMPAINSLLDRRQVVLEMLSQNGELTDGIKRELLALQAADKYLQRQLNAELVSIGRRLSAVSGRKRAISGYKKGRSSNHLNRTG